MGGGNGERTENRAVSLRPKEKNGLKGLPVIHSRTCSPASQKDCSLTVGFNHSSHGHGHCKSESTAHLWSLTREEAPEEVGEASQTYKNYFPALCHRVELKSGSQVKWSLGPRGSFQHEGNHGLLEKGKTFLEEGMLERASHGVAPRCQDLLHK